MYGADVIKLNVEVSVSGSAVFNIDADDASQEPNHGVWPALRLLLLSFLTSLLDFLDLADGEAQAPHIALQLGRDIWWQRHALRVWSVARRSTAWTHGSNHLRRN